VERFPASSAKKLLLRELRAAQARPARFRVPGHAIVPTFVNLRAASYPRKSPATPATVASGVAGYRFEARRKDMWCIPQVDAEYVARMEDVLDLYAESPDPNRPVVCFDESPTQLIGEVRTPIPAKPGQLERYDCEYRRNGTANLFVFVDVHRPWRKVKVTESRTAVDFAG